MMPDITTSILILTAITIIGSICISFMIILVGHWLAERADEHENTDERIG